MIIPFTKMQALGNDFIVMNSLHAPISFSTAEIIQLCNRRLGVGCDQLLIVEPSKNKEADFYYSIYNADGSEAQQCGNGVRCIAHYLKTHHLTDRNTLHLACKGGVVEATIKNNHQVTVNMGCPSSMPGDIPLNRKQEALTYTLSLPNEDILFGALSMGNPHAIICVDDFDIDVALLGHTISTHASFPQGVNVSFMKVTHANEAHLKVYERGIGLSSACGTAACAATVYGNKLGVLEHEVTMIQPGGNLFISWQGPHHPVYMTGPAETVFEGLWEFS